MILNQKNQPPLPGVPRNSTQGKYLKKNDTMISNSKENNVGTLTESIIKFWI